MRYGTRRSNKALHRTVLRPPRSGKPAGELRRQAASAELLVYCQTQ